MKITIVGMVMVASVIGSAQVTFTTRSTGTSQDLKGTTIKTGSEKGWTAGGGGVILITTDGGATWAAQSSGETATFEDISWGGSDDDGNDFVWACGNDITGINTTDGGTTWNRQLSGSQTAYGMNYQGIANGIIIGEDFSATSENGGISYSTILTSDSYRAVDFIGSTGWICGNAGIIKKTTDGGLTWSYQSSGIAATLHGIDFINANEGWASSNSGEIIHTTDGGATWTPQVSTTGYPLFSIKFSDNQNGWACGYIGTILRTTNGGETWVDYTPEAGTSVLLHSIALINANEGWIVGDDGVIISFEAEPSGVGMQDLSEVQLSVYPNPATSMLTIETTAEIQSIQIFDISGAMMLTETSSNFSVASLEQGVYFINVYTSEGLVTKRFVKS